MKLRNLFSIIGLLLFVYIILRIGVKDLINNFILVHPVYIVLNIILVFITFLLPTYKWQLILRSQGINVKFRTMLKIFLISTFYGNVTPGRIGSFIRVYYLKDVIRRPIGFCSSSIFIDRMFDLLILILFSMGGVLLVSKSYLWLFWLILIFFIILFLLFIFLLSKDRNRGLLKFIYNYFIPRKFKIDAKEGYHSFYTNIPDYKELIYPLFLTAVSWVLFYFLSYIFIIALGIRFSFIYYVFLASLATLVTLLPISIAGVGTREASLIVLLGLYGISALDVVVISVLSFIIFIFITSLIGWYLSIKWKNENID